MFPRTGIKIARIMGIDIVINPTWLLIFGLVAFTLGDTLRTPLQYITVVDNKSFPGGPWPWLVGIITAIVIFACLLAHELSHSYVAKRNGISIRRITLFIFGGVAEMSEDVSDATVEFKMAIAGPLMTFFLAAVFGGLYFIAYLVLKSPVLFAPLALITTFNLFVGVFNLLPGFPLDGGRVFRAIIWKTTGDLKRATRVASVAGQVVAAGLGLAGLYFFYVGAYVSGVWLILIAVFLFQLSRASYQQTLLRLAAADTTVGDLMYTDVPVVDAGTTLTDLRNHYFSVYHLPALPVADNGRLIGTVGREDLMGVAQAEWDVLNTGRIARPLEEGQAVTPDTPLDRILRTIMAGPEFLLIVEGEQVKGMLTRDELRRYVDARVAHMGR